MSIAARRLQRGVRKTGPPGVSKYTYTFEAGVVGSSISTSVTAPGDTPWTAVGIGSGSNLIYDTAHIGHGTKSAKLTSAAIETTARWTLPTATTTGAFRYYVLWDANPTANMTAVWIGGATGRAASIVLSPTGILRLYGSSSASAAYSTPDNTLPLGRWVRIEVLYQVDTVNPAEGKLRLALYNGESTTAVADSGLITVNAGASAVDIIRIGKFDTGANSSVHWLDSVAVHTNTTSFIGVEGSPPVNQLPTANAGSDQSVTVGSTVTLNGSGSNDPDGSITSYKWTQTAGPTVALSSTTAAQPTFTAPATAASLTFSLVVTDNNGATSAADTVTIGVTASSGLAYEWSDTNLPWAYATTSQFTAKWPTTGVNYVDYVPQGGDFYTELYSLVNSQPSRVVVRLPAGTFRLNQFRLIGSSGDPTYSFGFWHSKLRGLLGQGPDKTIIQMDPNSMSQAQLDKLSQMPSMGGVNQMSMWRFDGSSEAERVLIGGLTFRGTDQNMLNTVHSTLYQSPRNVVTPQPAPYSGIVLFPNAWAYLSYVRFQASAHAMTSAPPFEAGCVGSQYGHIEYDHCEMDGRLAPEVNPARPTRCTVVMGNNEYEHKLTDCWLHDSNVSRYAVNDENRETAGVYELTRTKIERITMNKNDGNGGYTNASVCGWESCSGTINVKDCIISVDNPNVEPAYGSSQHLQFTSVGSRNPQGGRLTVSGTQFRNTGFPSLNGFVTVRCITNTYWYTDGLTTTMNIKDANGNTLQPYVTTGGWPVSSTTLAANGITPSTHYLVRTV